MAIEHLKGFILILVILWIIWFFAIGPSKKEDDSLFITPPGETELQDSGN